LLSGIFFSSIVIYLLKSVSGGQTGFTRQKLALIGFKSGLIGIAILAVVYMMLKEWLAEPGEDSSAARSV
jgi:hypothetical protein